MATWSLLVLIVLTAQPSSVGILVSGFFVVSKKKKDFLLCDTLTAAFESYYRHHCDVQNKAGKMHMQEQVDG